ncbi:MAG TPA: Ldh family oxidoreductase [Chloroflexota bacterium]|jgi:LDH2 family malate/lactate/ureidoglycolate dehydrogenase
MADAPPAARYSAATLREFTAAVLRGVDLPAADAARVAELMIEADLSGQDGHGIFRLPQYVRRIRGGAVNVRPNIRVEQTAPATALVDGDNGMGHLVMSRAAKTAIALARQAGVAWVGVRRSNHAGPAALYATMPLAHDMIGIYAAVANANHMAPWGGQDLLLGTNPLAIAVPAGDEPPLVLDMATTVVSYGTVKKYAQRGQPIPPGWVTNAAGEAITDAARAGEGFLLPIGAYKGSGLALMLGLLAGVLNGAAFGRDVVDFNADDHSTTNTGHLLIAVDVARFVPLDVFKAAVDRHVRDLRASRRLPGVEAIYMPGEQRHARIQAHLAHGIPLPAALVADLDAVATSVGVAPLSAAPAR